MQNRLIGGSLRFPRGLAPGPGLALAFLGLLGLERASFTMALKPAPPSWTYVATVFTLTALFEILPYLEELLRGIRHKGSPQ